MAEATPTETYLTFQAEQVRLETELGTLKISNDLSALDTIAADTTKLQTIRDRLLSLAEASERYEKEQRFAALLAVQTPRWADAARGKVAALGEVSEALNALLAALGAYSKAHGEQTAVLMALGYTREYRLRFASAPASAIQICTTVLGGDRSWLSRVRTFDDIGTSHMLPDE